jgi:predicted flap endonuclease-1-like 5' DNA nuclease
MPQIADVEGIGPAFGAKLESAGVKTTDALLERAARPKGRHDLAQATGIRQKLILDWVNRVDLARIKGVGSEYADLLEAAGVDSPAELAQRVPAHLLTKLQSTNESKHLVRRVPTMSDVEHWITEAKAMPKIVEH